MFKLSLTFAVSFLSLCDSCSPTQLLLAIKSEQVTYTWFTDGSYAIVSDTIVVESWTLLAHTTNQHAELIALSHACQLTKV